MQWEDLGSVTKLDPTLTYPYMYRAASSMRKQDVQGAPSEINRVLGFKLALECLELRFCFYLVLEDDQSAICDVQVILTLSPDYRMFTGRVAAFQLRTLVREHVENWMTADCWMQLYDRWSSEDDIRHCEEGLQKAEDYIKIKRSFEAFFLKAFALADSSRDPSCSSTVVSLLEDTLKCPSDRLRKGQFQVHRFMLVAVSLSLLLLSFAPTFQIRCTRAHQGLARVHYLWNEKAAAYEEMTKLIEKAWNNASAYKKRSEYCERELTKADLEMVTKLDPLRVYPYRYRAAG
ncbi:hypothetical protein CRG98_039776 [Punica granatum]|uniref:Uncharacterized protein n=1 Tax=Punica granatum TaxID=22663 RepID=A0A2I0I747_PUNGR|nr:hypothetical protein CRG98_039776 [Punica granatum]